MLSFKYGSESPSLTTAFSPGAVSWRGGHVFDSAHLESVTSEGPEGGLGAGAKSLAVVA